MAHSHGSSTSLAFLAGIGAGAVAALLFAPRTGQETRSQLKDAAMNARNKAQQTMEEQKSKVEVNVDKAKDKVHELTDKGAETINDTADTAADKAHRGMPRNL